MLETTIDKIGELIVVDHKTLPALFSEGKAHELVDEIEKKARSFVPDVETTKGRKDIASLAHKIARSKTTLDAAGNQLTAEWKAKAKLVDQERSTVWSRLESLQDEIRRPLTEYERKDKERILDHKNALCFFDRFTNSALNCSSAEDMQIVLKKNEEHFNSRDWEEFLDAAKEDYRRCEMIINHHISNTLIQKLEMELRVAKEEAEKQIRLAEERARIAEQKEKDRVNAQKQEVEREAARIAFEKQEEKHRELNAQIEETLKPIEEELIEEENDNEIIEWCDSTNVMRVHSKYCEPLELSQEKIYEYRKSKEFQSPLDYTPAKSKVYVVTEYYSNVRTNETTNIAVFSSEAAANLFVKEKESKAKDCAYVSEEHEVIE